MSDKYILVIFFDSRFASIFGGWILYRYFASIFSVHGKLLIMLPVLLYEELCCWKVWYDVIQWRTKTTMYSQLATERGLERGVGTIGPATDLLPRKQLLKLQRFLTVLALVRADTTVKVKVVELPDVHHSFDKLVHHVFGVVGGGCHPQALWPPGHRWVIYGLDIDIMLAHEVIGQLCTQGSVSHLECQTKTTIIF